MISAWAAGSTTNEERSVSPHQNIPMSFAVESERNLSVNTFDQSILAEP